tara:strand:+ start:315 stop:467 length:153 start_codon:yes stop_codon:yes gene_type:complete
MLFALENYGFCIFYELKKSEKYFIFFRLSFNYDYTSETEQKYGKFNGLLQ